MTMHSLPRSVNDSWHVTMFGWCSAARSCASSRAASRSSRGIRDTSTSLTTNFSDGSARDVTRIAAPNEPFPSVFTRAYLSMMTDDDSPTLMRAFAPADVGGSTSAGSFYTSDDIGVEFKGVRWR